VYQYTFCAVLKPQLTVANGDDDADGRSSRNAGMIRIWIAMQNTLCGQSTISEETISKSRDIDIGLSTSFPLVSELLQLQGMDLFSKALIFVKFCLDSSKKSYFPLVFPCLLQHWSGYWSSRDFTVFCR